MSSSRRLSSTDPTAAIHFVSPVPLPVVQAPADDELLSFPQVFGALVLDCHDHLG